MEAVTEAGIVDVVRAKKTRRAKATADITPETAAERRDRRRIKDTERKRQKRAKTRKAVEEAGTYRGRGRPRLSNISPTN